MAGLREKQKADRQQRILAAAERLFRRDGYQHTRIEDIASDADVSVGTIYNYFQNKSDLVLKLVSSSDEAIAKELQATQPTDRDDPVESIHRVFEITTRRSLERLGRENWRHLLATSITQQGSDLGVRYLELTQRLNARVVAGLAVLAKREFISSDIDLEHLGKVLCHIESALYLELVSSDTAGLDRYRSELRQHIAFVLGFMALSEEKRPPND